MLRGSNINSQPKLFADDKNLKFDLSANSDFLSHVQTDLYLDIFNFHSKEIQVLASGRSTVVEHLPPHLKVKGLSQATTAGTGGL